MPGTQQTLPTPGFSRKQLDSCRPTILLCASFPTPPENTACVHGARGDVCTEEAERREDRAMLWSPFSRAQSKLVTAQKRAGATSHL